MLLRRLLARLQGAILDQPVPVLAASALMLAVAIWLGAGVEFRTSRNELAPPDDTEQRKLDELLREAGGDDTLIVCVERVDEQQTGLDAIRDFTDVLAGALAEHPEVGGVFYKIPLDWFLERGLYLVPPETVDDTLRRVEARRQELLALARMDELADLNHTLAAGLREAMREGSRPPENAGEGLPHIVELIRAESRFLADPEAFLAPFESRSPMALLAGAHRVVASEGYLATRDGSKLFIIVSRAGEDDSLPVLRSFVAAMRENVSRVSSEHPGFNVAFTGRPAMTVEEMDTVRRDTWFTSLVAVAGVTILTLLVFRWRGHVFLVLTALLCGVVWAFGAVRLEYGYLNMITSAFISTLIGVGVAYGIHPVSEYELEGAHTRDPKEAVREAYHRTGAPVAVAAVTTSAAFFSILLMRFRGFAELGLVAGVGVLLCLIAALVTLPAILVVYGRWRHRRDREHRASTVDRIWVERAATRVCRFPRTVTVIGILITAVLAWQARDIEFNTNILDLLPRNSEALQYQTRMLMESDLSPVAGVIAATDVAELRELAARARAQPAIVRFESALQFLPEDPQRSRESIRRVAALLDELDLPPRTAPFDAAVLRESLLDLEDALAEAAESAFGAGMGELVEPLEEARAAAEQSAGVIAEAGPEHRAEWDRGQRRLLEWVHRLRAELRRATTVDPPTLESLPEAIRKRFQTSDGRLLAYLQPRGSLFDGAVLEEYVFAARQVSDRVFGFPIVFHRMSGRITSGFYRAVALGSTLVFCILLIDYRNLRDAGLAIVPLAVGVVWMMGLMGVFGLSFNFANLVAVPLIIGVGIDNGVHVVHRLRFEGSEGMAVVLRHTGRAILIASLTTMIGFGSLALASHRGLESLGLVLLLGVGSCLVTSMGLLPNLLVALGKARR